MPWEGPPAPYRIETERLVIRCYEPRDAAMAKEAIDSSLDHLRPWMPWTENEPQTLEEWKAAYFAVLKSNHSLQAEVRTLREALSYHSPGGAECREPVAACPMCAALATPRADVQG